MLEARRRWDAWTSQLWIRGRFARGKNADLVRIGTTSLTYRVEAWVLRKAHTKQREKVTEGLFTYVALDENAKPRPVPKEPVD